MAVTVRTLAERPDLRGRGVDPALVWPEYNLHGDVLNRWWPLLGDEFPACQFVLYDDEAGAVLAEGHTAPLGWDGDDTHLPDGIDAAVVEAFRRHRAGEKADTLCALAAEVPRTNRSRGLAAELLVAMTEIARREGLARLVAPVRPSAKHRYPLTPIDRYVAWRRADGWLLDPWMRVHERLGARVSTPLPRSMRITGTVADWERWTGLALPESGDYVFPDGLDLLHVDRDRDRGEYWEPNVWMVHPALG